MAAPAPAPAQLLSLLDHVPLFSIALFKLTLPLPVRDTHRTLLPIQPLPPRSLLSYVVATVCLCSLATTLQLSPLDDSSRSRHLSRVSHPSQATKPHSSLGQGRQSNISSAMSTQAAMGNATPGVQKIEKKPIKFSNLLVGAGMNMFEVTTLGQPLEVIKTTMAANRSDTFPSAMSRVWGRGGVLGCKS